MNTININTSAPYEVLAGNGLIAKCGELIRTKARIRADAGTAAVITDDKVGAVYADTVLSSLEAAGFKTVIITVKNGEESKRIGTYGDILEQLAAAHVTRSDFIAALGGGVIGDMAGFAAASYLRKVDFVQIPTTLLAQVDSSVGGKVGIDLMAGKNMAGAFYQPKLVIADMDVLDTLSENDFAAGCAEVIKYGVLWDEALFRHLEEHGRDFDREYVISRCVELKRDVVVEDEFDNGRRQFLNLGHTIGHAAEQLSDFKLLHGFAVAEGLATVARAALYDGTCDRTTVSRIEALLQKFGLPVSTGRSMDELYRVMQSDKKRKGGSITIVVPQAIGRCELRRLKMDEMREFMSHGV